MLVEKINAEIEIDAFYCNVKSLAVVIKGYDPHAKRNYYMINEFTYEEILNNNDILKIHNGERSCKIERDAVGNISNVILFD